MPSNFKTKMLSLTALNQTVFGDKFLMLKSGPNNLRTTRTGMSRTEDPRTKNRTRTELNSLTEGGNLNLTVLGNKCPMLKSEPIQKGDCPQTALDASSLITNDELRGLFGEMGCPDALTKAKEEIERLKRLVQELQLMKEMSELNRKSDGEAAQKSATLFLEQNRALVKLRDQNADLNRALVELRDQNADLRTQINMVKSNSYQLIQERRCLNGEVRRRGIEIGKLETRIRTFEGDTLKSQRGYVPPIAQPARFPN